MRRRPPKWVAALSAVVIVVGSGTVMAAAAGRIATAASYRPLKSGTFFGVRGARSLGRPGVLRYEHRKDFRYLFDVTNRGRWPVTVTGVYIPPYEEDLDFLAERVAVEMGARIGDLDARPVPFEPFVLPPGEFRLLYVEARFVNCKRWPPTDTMGISTQSITYEAFGLERRMDVKLPRPVIIAGPPLRDCPPRERLPVPAGP